jgi:hypothetical protein
MDRADPMRGVQACSVVVPIVALLVAGPLDSRLAARQDGGAADAKARAAFEASVGAYVEQHRQLDMKVAELHGSDVPSVIAAHRVNLGKLIIAARRDSHRGDILTAEVEAWLRRLVRSAYPDAELAKLRAMVMEDLTPVRRLRVNTPFPTDARSLMPPRLLAGLPALPEEVEYRFVGRHFVLTDVETDLIVDFIYNLI